MTFQENVVVVAQRDFPFCGLVGREGMRFLVTFQIAAAAHFHGDGEFVAVQRLGVLSGPGAGFGIPVVLLRILGIDVNQLDDEIAVGAGGRGEEMGGQRPGDGEIVVERSADET